MPKPTKECLFCKNRTLTELPLKTNADTSRTLALIAQGDNKREIVFSIKGVAYGIEIDFCPICGRNLSSKTSSTTKKKRKYFRKCGRCEARLEQSDMIRTDKSPNGWLCSDCYYAEHPEYLDENY
jgi:hypothetical protein